MKNTHSNIDRRKNVKWLSVTSIFYAVSMTIITASVLFFIDDYRVRSQSIIELIDQQNSLVSLKAKQASIRTNIFKLIYFQDDSLTSEILSSTEDYEFILNSFINVANKNRDITDILLFNEIIPSFTYIRELSYQLVRNVKNDEVSIAASKFKAKYVQSERIMLDLINDAQHRKEQSIETLNEENEQAESIFFYIFLIEILITLIITYIINHRVKIKLDQSTFRLNKLATQDVLTGLYNRRLFMAQLKYSLKVMKKNGQKLTLFFIDLDGFKLINDTKGHYVGDKILKEVAQRISNGVRESDLVYRLGGDEFTIILEDASEVADYQTVVEKLLKSICKPYYVEKQEIYISASIGISVFPDHGQTVDSIINAADAAMYQVKSKGKNNYLCFSEKMLREINYYTQLKNDLRDAAINNELFLLYQPKIDLLTGALIGCEALVRWQHPQQGIISPVEFITMAEETGYINDIGLWLVKTVSAQIVDWRKRNIAIPQVAINLSGTQLESSESLNNLFMILAENPFPSSMLEFELTESVIMGYQHTDALQSLTRLQECGHNISIDDFGTGYSSLSYLRHLPIDTLKIDRSFITDVIEREDDQAIIKAILALANSLGLKTVAEGVESKAQLDFLKACGCDQVQGYYFSKPLSAKRIEAFVEFNQFKRAEPLILDQQDSSEYIAV
jgi:diguanylate cyclase (GGDEF)-like protein